MTDSELNMTSVFRADIPYASLSTSVLESVRADRVKLSGKGLNSTGPLTPADFEPLTQADVNRAPSSPRFSSLRGFRTRALRRAPRACKGPASETLQQSGLSRPRPWTPQLVGSCRSLATIVGQDSALSGCSRRFLV